MKSGDRFSEYMVQRSYFGKEGFHLEYERLKALLKDCHHNRRSELDGFDDQKTPPTIVSSSEPCPDCEEIFLSEVTQQISAIVGCFTSRARRLLRPHFVSGFQRYFCRPRHLFVDYRQKMMEEARNLIIYMARNAIAIRKLLIEYEKIQRCRSSKNDLGSKLQAKRIELLQSPWLIELCAFQINATSSRGEDSSEIYGGCSVNFNITDMNGPSITCKLLKSVNLDFNLSCPICLDTAFEPVALGCGHVFCNSCACSSVSVPTISGVKAANKRAKCPLCRQMGVFANSVHLIQSGLLLKKRCKEFWKERLKLERVERVKQAKEHWNEQSRLFLGF